MLKTVGVILALAGLLYAALLTVVYVRQRSMLYFPQQSRSQSFSPAASGLAAFQIVRLRTSDGETLLGWWKKPAPGRGVVVYFHGNAGSLSGAADRLRTLAGAGLGVLAIEYRAYGDSTGRPTQAGLTADGLAAFDFAQAAAPHARVALFGESLGTAIAITVAAQRPSAGLVLDSPFSSAVRPGERQLPWAPVRLLMKDPWESEMQIGKIAAPVLIGHCSGDRVVPLAEARRLYRAAGEPKRMMVFADCSHTQSWEAGLRAPGLESLRAWTNADGPPAGPP